MTRDDLLAAAEALAAVLDRDLVLLRQLAMNDPVKLEQIGWNLRDRCSGQQLGGESWQEGLAAAELIVMVANGQPVPALTGAKADMIAGVQAQLIELAIEAPTIAPNRAQRRAAARRVGRVLH